MTRPNINISDVQRDFIAAMHTYGLELCRGDLLEGDGRFHRCDVSRKDRPGNRDGSYRLNLHAPIPYGGFHDFTSREGWKSWRFKVDRKLTADEQREIERFQAELAEEYVAWRAEMMAKAAVKALGMWKNAQPAEDYPYCRDKGVRPRGLKVYRFRNGDEVLLVPMFSGDVLANVQMIYPDGAKRFLKDGQYTGTHYWINPPDEDESLIYIAEGWADGETIYQASEAAVLISLGTKNLVAAAEYAHEQYPHHNIVVCADDDWKVEGNPGLAKATEAAQAVGGKLAIPSFGDNRSKGDTDFNDLLLKDGLAAVRRDLAAARPPAEVELVVSSREIAETDTAEERRKQKQVDQLYKLVKGDSLFHDAEDNPYADLKIDGHRETWPVKSQQFKRWLARQFFERQGTTPSSEALRSALGMIEAQACWKGPQRQVFIRIAGVDSHTVYLDLGDKDWRAVRIDDRGWKIVQNPKVRFIRRKGMLPLPVPERGGSIEDLRSFINVHDDGDFVLIVSWLLGAFRPRGPYTTLLIWGEAGSAKSTLLRLLRELIDPNAAPLRAPPRDNRDLWIAAVNAYVPCFDNLSDLPDWMSDSLARLNTGGGFGTRQLYSDDEERLFDAARPVLLGAIEHIIEKGDLAERTTPIKLSHIPDDQRRTEKELWKKFRRLQPGILGALLTAVSAGLKALPEVKPKRLPRMADFAEWGIACEPALWEPGTFIAAYRANLAAAVADVVEANLVGSVLQAFIANKRSWTGSHTDLLEELGRRVDEQQRLSRSWPKAPNALSGRLTRLAGDLRKSGIDIQDSGRDPVTNRKLITITLTREVRTRSLRSLGSLEGPKNKALENNENNDPNDLNDLIRTSPTETGFEVAGPVRAKPRYIWMTPEQKERRIAHMRRIAEGNRRRKLRQREWDDES